LNDLRLDRQSIPRINPAIARDALNEEFGMFPMKTATKTVFGLMTVGFVLGTLSHQSLAQDKPAAPEKPMSPQAMEILCKRFPLNSRCQGGAATPASTDSAGAASSTTPTTSPSGSTTPDKPAEPTTPAAGAPPADPMAPKSDAAPPADAPKSDAAPPADAPKSDAAPSADAPKSDAAAPADAPKSDDMKGDMPKGDMPKDAPKP
jgi:outer membrane biosynthesis protein TonB